MIDKLQIDVNLNCFRQYGVLQSAVKEAIGKPDQAQKLPNDSRLYLKNFPGDDTRRGCLLVGTQASGNGESLSFAYWIPKEYADSKIALIEILKLFANRFGLKIRVGASEGYFIRHVERITQRGLTEPAWPLVEIMSTGAFRYEIITSTTANQLGTLNNVYFHYAFCINIGKYLFWVDLHPCVNLRLREGWISYVKSNLLDQLQPDGRTQITAIRQTTNENLIVGSSTSIVDIEVPKIYEKKLNHIFEQINDLKDKELIFFKVALESSRDCLFCDSKANSKEHIFSKWLRKYTDNQEFEPIGMIHDGSQQLKPEDAISLTTEKGNSYGYTAPLVCRDCNSGWMSSLDENIKSILIRNEELVESISDISKESAISLSRWLIMKSLILSNKLSFNQHHIEKYVYKKLKDKIIDDGFLVEITNSSNSKIDFFVGRGLQNDKLLRLNRIELKRAKAMTENFFICCLQFGNLLFRISYVEKELPFIRSTSLYKTTRLFPYLANLKHIEVKSEKDILRMAINKNIEIGMLGSSLLLVEKSIA